MTKKNPEKTPFLFFPCLIILLMFLSSCAQTKVSGSGITGIKEMEPQNAQVLDESNDLSSIANWMQTNPTSNLVIAGYGEENKSAEYSRALADRRANSSRDSLINLGIASSHLKTVSWGEEKPFSTNHPEEPWTQGRRVHFIVENRERSMPPKHVFSWQCLYSLNGEKSGYATYSYVLTGRSATNSNALARYLKLIEAVKEQSTPDSLITATSRGSYNLFLIPSKNDSNTADCKPDYGLLKQLLDTISIKSGKAFPDSGPYIIALYKSIGAGDPKTVADILYMDLTGVHPAAFPEFIRSYKNHVSTEHIRDIKKLRTLKGTVLSTMLIFEECIGFAKVAYADLQRPFSHARRGKPEMQRDH